MPAWTLRAARGLILGVTIALPLVVWPGLARSFSTPKLWLLAGASLLVLAAAWRPFTKAPADPGPGQWLTILPGVWLASWIVPSLFGEVVSIESLVTAIVAGLWATAVLAARPRARDLAVAAVVGGSGVALVALMQWAGYDPFVAAGWLPSIQGASIRMRVYATQGNPNFAAAVLAATLPLTAALVGMAGSRAGRTWAAGLMALQLIAIAATGSRAGGLGIMAAAAAWAWVDGRARKTVLVAAVLALALVVLFSQARPLRQTFEGRLYMWRTVGQQVMVHPWVGFGPGGVEAHYADWLADNRRLGVPVSATARFGRPEQHAHNDYLEAAVERGLPGLLAFVLVVFVPLACAARPARPALQGARFLRSGGAGAVAALAAIAAVDFPFARPDELVSFWTAVVIITLAPTDS